MLSVRSATVLILALASVAPSLARAGDLVVPAGADPTTGGFDLPFDVLAGGTARYQQDYAASAFPFTGPHDITAVSFRVLTINDTFKGTIGNIDIRLSTSPKTPSTLGPTFSQNVGADEVVVYSGPLTLSTAATFMDPSKPFDVTIPFKNPFSYDPAAGSLLLDVRNLTGGHTSTFNEVESDLVASTFSHNVDAAADGLRHSGLVTQFTITGFVPEPASAMLMVTAATVLLGRRRRSRV